jgi:hypothetical protein
MFNRKKKIKTKLEESFGKLKEDSFDFESIEKYFRKKDKSDSFQVISDKTCNDLDFEDFFMFVDRTNSRIGQQFYYDTLRTIPIGREKFTLQEQLINSLENDPKLRTEIQYHLLKLANNKALYIIVISG